jgi:hypothetical protein
MAIPISTSAQLPYNLAKSVVSAGSSLVSYGVDGKNFTTVAAKLGESKSVKDFGAIGDGKHNDTSAISSALKSGGTITFPAGEYIISNAVEILSNTKLVGQANATIIWSGANPATGYVGIFMAQGRTNISIEGMNLQAAKSTSVVYALICRSCSHVWFTKNTMSGGIASVYTTVPIPGTSTLAASAFANQIDYSLVTDANANSEIHIHECAGSGIKTGYASGAYLSYLHDSTVTSNRFDSYAHGIGWWGGDANANGALSNIRKVYNLTISDNVVTNVNGGGIWGSMGQQVSVVGNSVQHCNDICIDFEGCLDCSCTGNNVYDGQNGALATYYTSINIVFSGNTVRQPVAIQPLFNCSNSGVASGVKGTLINGNTFIAEQSVGKLDGGQWENIVISDNILRNVYIKAIGSYLNPNHDIKIVNNDLTFDTAADVPLYAICVQSCAILGSVQGICDVSGNKISSQVTQPAGSYAISVYQDDPAGAPVTRIDGNTIIGWPNDICTQWAGSSATYHGMFWIKNNSLHLGNVTRIETGAAKGWVALAGNKTAYGNNYPDGIPTSGYWDAGQRVDYDRPALGAATGAICTTAGTPGTWQALYPGSAGGGGISALTGDVTASGTGSVAATIGAGTVTLAKMANLAANSIIGNNTGSPATPIALTAAQVKTELAIAQADVSGLTTGSSPTFVGETLSGMTVAGFVKNNASGVLSGGNSLAMSDLPADAVARAVSFVFTNGGSALVTGIPPGFFPQFRIAANLMGWELTASGSGSAVLDILSANNAIPTASNSMATGNSHTGTPPTLASVQLAGGTSFTNWYKTAIAVNDFLGFNLLSVSSGITALTLTLFLQAT